jgi:carbonic anhydrase
MKTKTILSTVLLALVASIPVRAEDHPAEDAAKPVSFEEALRRLEEGNARYVAAKPKHPHESIDWRHSLEQGQHPFAVVIGCSDSRVIPELIFDQGLGDLFVIRVAGNIVDTDVAASVEYAVNHLGTELVLVLGHSHCGAVTATIDHFTDAEGEPAEVVSLLNMIEPALIGLPENLPREEQIKSTIKRNVDLAVRRLSRIPDLHRSEMAGKVGIVGAVYDMHTGKVDIPHNPVHAIRK